MERFTGYFTKMFYGKKHVSYPVQDYIKSMIFDFSNKRRKMFNFRTFKIVVLATVNSIIVTALISLKLYTVLLLKISDHKKTTRYSDKRCHNF